MGFTAAASKFWSVNLSVCQWRLTNFIYISENIPYNSTIPRMCIKEYIVILAFHNFNLRGQTNLIFLYVCFSDPFWYFSFA